MTVWLTPHANLLNEVVVFAENPRMIVEKAISKIPLNYSDKRDMLTGFYRETVQKGRRYIGISEAVIDVSKTAYTNRNTNYDKVRVVKGRRLLSQKASDTLAVKVVGGPNLSITLDVVKNKGALLDMEELNNYEFWMAESMLIDNRMQYVINFRPKVILMYALLYGKLYIDRERLSFTRIEMSLDMQDKSKVTTAILYKKPLGLRFKPQELYHGVVHHLSGPAHRRRSCHRGGYRLSRRHAPRHCADVRSDDTGFRHPFRDAACGQDTVFPVDAGFSPGHMESSAGYCS